MDEVLGKLHSIQQLWSEVQRTKPNTPKYETLLKRISALSSEYQMLVESKMPKHPSRESVPIHPGEARRRAGLRARRAHTERDRGRDRARQRDRAR
jgi:hypothetical protein